MLRQSQFAAPHQVDRLTKAAAALGYEIVDIAGFLDLVDEHARAQTRGLNVLKARTEDMSVANADVLNAVQTMAEYTSTTVQDVATSADTVRRSSEKSHTVAAWVQEISSRTATVSETIAAVRKNNQQIASIAMQVNTLAINAKIEAARAGDAGKGFAVVAEAINELSRKTRDAAVEISDNIETLTSWIADLGKEAGDISIHATDVLEDAGGTDDALGRVERSITDADAQARRITEQARRVEQSMQVFAPALTSIGDAISATSSGIETTHERVLRLIDTSEAIVQATALMNDASEDAMFIKYGQKLAAQVCDSMEAALADGRITLSRLFDRTYRPIPDTNPEQFMTESTAFMGVIMPPIQEPALALDPKVVFCAAVDVNGYLPSHNKRFSHQQTNDPIWNAGHCRNRRIFNDRVGLKAGRSTEPFLLQVYRRDMGGGAFKMMKDLSVPINVQGRHWGGLRLAYSFD